MNDHKLFITSVLLLVGLTVLGSALQNRPAPPAPAATQTKSAAAPQTAAAPVNTPQPGATAAPAAKPQIRGYNGEYEDD